MNLDTDYRLISDAYNFILQKKLPMRNKKRAQRSKEWINVSYWKDVGQALQGYARCAARPQVGLTSFSRLSALSAHKLRLLGSNV